MNLSNPSSSILLIIAACIAAPIATDSSAFICIFNTFSPENYFFTISCNFGILVEPPTKTTSLISSFFRLASFKAESKDSCDFLDKSVHLSLKSGLEIGKYKSYLPYKGSKSILTSIDEDKLLLAFSIQFKSSISFLSFSIIHFFLISILYFSIKASQQILQRTLSKSSPLNDYLHK